MKDNKLYSAMSHIDDELISEAVNASKVRKLPVFRITAAAAALVFIALTAAVIVNLTNKPEIIAEPDVSDDQTSEIIEISDPETNREGEGGTAPAVSSEESAKAEEPQESAAVEHDTPSEDTSSENIASDIPEEQTSGQTSSDLPNVGDEESDMLGFIVTDDGKVYMQVFNSTEYTLDEDIGRAGDFRGCYNGLVDNSRVYTVKEDDNILVVKFESGGIVTLMLREEGLMDRLGYYLYHGLRVDSDGLRVDSSLMAALSSNDGKAYNVYVTRPDSEDMYDYVYNGKTLRQMKEELDESWKTEHGKYNPLDDEYQAALDAFLKEKIKTVYDLLVVNGIQAEIINGVRCEMTITKEQFDILAAEGGIPDEYAFGLSSGGYFVDDPEA